MNYYNNILNQVQGNHFQSSMAKHIATLQKVQTINMSIVEKES